MSQYHEHFLLDSQWDSVLLLIRRLEFDVNEFERTTNVTMEPYAQTIPELVHKPTNSRISFDFDPHKKSHSVWYTPGEDSPSDSANGLDWPSVLYWAEKWLENIKREQATPNLWNMLDESRELLAGYEETGGGETDDTPFSAEEQAQIAAQLDELKELLVSQHGADPESLSRDIEELKEASKRSGRREWLFLFLGVGLHWTLTGLVPPEGLRAMLSLAAQGIGHFFGGMPQLGMP